MGVELIHEISQGRDVSLSRIHPETMSPLLGHLTVGLISKIQDAEKSGDTIEILDPNWCRSHPEEAGSLHADIIVKAYGPTYALPNKNPIANTLAIEDGSLDLYLMKTNGSLTGTACMVDNLDGRAELGRAASLGRSRNSIIQDLRIIDWLNDDTLAQKYHSLFATLRSAPDRKVETSDGNSFVMRGGQAVTSHWNKLPNLQLYGVAPLYLKANELEQFAYAALTRTTYREPDTVYIASPEGKRIADAWCDEYSMPNLNVDSSNSTSMDTDNSGYDVHYPPLDTGLTGYVHADIVRKSHSGKTVEDCVKEAELVGSPFIQVEVPVESDTRNMQYDLELSGFKAYGYRPSTSEEQAALLFGRLREGVRVVPTFWDAENKSNPFWSNNLGRIATDVALSW